MIQWVIEMSDTTSIRISRPLTDVDRNWLRELWYSEWGGDFMVSKGKVHHLDEVKALIAWSDDTPVGAATYHHDAEGCELLSINALQDGLGNGSRLLSAVEETARQAGLNRVWLITSNDNLGALRFYQRRGYRISAVYPGAIGEARKMKPSIPTIGDHGIPIHDELELEKWL